jgi:cytochrome b subunit of formate dehydrogenase
LVDKKKVKRITHITLGIISVIVILSGLGIAYYQTVTYLTMGFLDKTLAFKLHTYLFPLFLIILILHSFMPSILKALNYK